MPSLPAGTDVSRLPTFTAAPPILTPDVFLQVTDAPQPVAASVTSPVTAGAIPNGYQVRVHPDGALYAGDWVSFEVIRSSGEGIDEQTVSISRMDGQSPVFLGEAQFGFFGIQGRSQATFLWLWDTKDAPAGEQQMIFSVQPGNLTWSETLTLLPASALRADEREASWTLARSNCCAVYYMTETAAERDIGALLDEMDAQAQDAVARMGVEFSQPITVTLAPRLLGHGGFASDIIHVSYLDRNYAGGSQAMVLHHEMIHILDSRLGGELRPSMFVEGLAVYMSGGHFKPEPLLPRAAAMLYLPDDQMPGSLGWYTPLELLANDFYHYQHEQSYLQAGALIEYMVHRWGWEAFSAFYRDIHPHATGSQTQAIEAALQEHFGLTLSELEGAFVEELRHIYVTADEKEDVRLTVSFYDAVRRYQQALDPSAYFLTAWLADSNEMRRRGITADYLRHPQSVKNIALELLLVLANRDLVQGNYTHARRNLAAVNQVLDQYALNPADAFVGEPLAEDMLAIVQVLQSQQMMPQRVALGEDSAIAWVGLGNEPLRRVDLVRAVLQGWQVVPEE